MLGIGNPRNNSKRGLTKILGKPSRFLQKEAEERKRSDELPSITFFNVVACLNVLLRAQKKIRLNYIVKELKAGNILEEPENEPRSPFSPEKKKRSTRLAIPLNNVNLQLIAEDPLLRPYPLELREVLTWKAIREEFYTEGGPPFNYLFSLRKMLTLISNRIVKNQIFQLYSVFSIVCYCVLLAYKKDRLDDSTGFGEAKWLNVMSVLNVVELGLRLSAKGNFFDFFQNPWNVIDFCVIGSSVLFPVFYKDPLDFIPVRLLCLFKYIHIFDFQSLLLSVYSSIKLLSEVLLIFFFFILLFAFCALHLFKGLLKQHCFNPQTGVPHPENLLCGNIVCPARYICGRSLRNHEGEGASFDDVLSSFVEIFRQITLDDWALMMYNIQKTFSNYSWIFFVLVIIVGNYFLINMILAVLKVKYVETLSKIKTGNFKSFRQIKTYDLRYLKNVGIYINPHRNIDQEGEIEALRRRTLRRKSNHDKVLIAVKNTLRKGSVDSSFYRASMTSKEAKEPGSPRTPRALQRKKAEFDNQIRQFVRINENFTAKLKNFMIGMFKPSDLEIKQNRLVAFLKPKFKQDFLSKTDVIPKKSRANLLKNKKREYVLTLKKYVDKIDPVLFEDFNYESDRVKIWEFSSKILNPEPQEPLLPLKKQKQRRIHLHKPLSQGKIKTSLTRSLLKKNIRRTAKATNKGLNTLFKVNTVGHFADRLANKQIEKSEKKKPDFSFDNQLLYEKILLTDNENSRILNRIWSGNAVLIKYDFKKLRIVFRDLGKRLFSWKQKGMKEIMFMRTKLKPIIRGNLFVLFFMLLSVATLSVLVLEGLIDDWMIVRTLTIFNILFYVEFALKIFALGVKKVLKEKHNIVDCFINIQTLLALLFYHEIQSLFPSFRIFRCVLVFRVVRVYKSMELMNFIFTIISDTVNSFLSIAIMLFGLIVIYTLLGQQLFKKNLNVEILALEQKNFDRFSTGFMTVFQIITLDNWHKIYLQCSELVTVNRISLSLYLVSLIFFGNFLMLNLFIANMLSGFENLTLLDLETLMKENESTESTNDALQVFLKKETSVVSSNSKKSTPVLVKRNKLRKQLQESEGKFLDYHKIDERASLGLFPKSSNFRRVCYLVTSNKAFEVFVLFMVFLNASKNAFDTFIDWDDPEDKPTLRNISNSLNLILNSVFFVEACLKIVTYGFFMSNNSYMRDFLNVIDVLCLVTFALDLMTADSPEINTLKAFTLLRILRPIRIFQFNQRTKIIFNALLESFNQIFRVFFVIVAVWLMFGLIGVELFRGRFYYCSSPEKFKICKILCDEWKLPWVLHSNNFENILESSMSLLIISTFDNWSQILNIAVNSNNETDGPIEYNNQYSSYIYFVSFIIIGAYFFINLFIGVIFSNFTLAQRKGRHSFLTEDEMKWVDVLKIIKSSEPYPIQYPTKGLKQTVYNIVSRSKKFDFFIMSCLLFDFLHHMAYFYGAGQIIITVTTSISIFVTLVFLAEFLLKIYAYGLKGYFYYYWHRLEFIILLSYCLYYSLEYFTEGSDLIEGYTNRALRASVLLRLASSFRFIAKFHTLRNFLVNMFFSIPLLFVMLCALLLVFFLYSVIGCFLFRNVKKGEILDDYVNFQNFIYAMMTLFRCSTATDWFQLMKDTSKTEPNCAHGRDCGSRWSPLFFITFMLLTNYLLINLFLLIILQQFESLFVTSINPVELFTNISMFRMAWSRYCQRNNMSAISIYKVIDFERTLELPLGYPRGASFKQIGKKILKKKIFCNEKGEISFHDMLYASLRDHYFEKIARSKAAKSKRIMKAYELKFLESCHPEIDIRNNPHLAKGKANPLYIYLSSLVAFLAWRNLAQDIKKQEQDSKRSSKVKQTKAEIESPKKIRSQKSKFSIFSDRRGSSRRDLISATDKEDAVVSPKSALKHPAERDSSNRKIKRDSRPSVSVFSEAYSNRDGSSFMPAPSMMHNTFKNSIVIFDIKNTNYFVNKNEPIMQMHPFFVNENKPD